MDLLKEWETFTPGNKRTRGGRRKRRYCFALGLESISPSGAPLKYGPYLNAINIVGHGLTDDPGGWRGAHAVGSHFDISLHKPWHAIGVIGPVETGEINYWDGQPINIEGLSGQNLVDAIWSSPNNWILGAFNVEDENPINWNGYHLEYFPYRLISHLLFLTGNNPVISHPRQAYLLAHWTMRWHIQQWASDDTEAPFNGEVINGIPPCEEQTPHILFFPDITCVQPMGKWVVASFPEPSATSNWFTFWQDALKEIALRNDGVFEEMLKANCFGFSLTKLPGNIFKLWIVYI